MVIGIRMWTSAILPLRGGRFEFVVFEFVIVDYCGSVESEIVPGAALHPRLYSAACDSGLRSTRVCVPPFSVAMSSGVHCDMFDEPSLRTNSHVWVPIRFPHQASALLRRARAELWRRRRLRDRNR